MFRAFLRLKWSDVVRLRLSERQKRRLRVFVARQMYLDRKRFTWLVVLGVGITAVVILTRVGANERRGVEAFEQAEGGGISEAVARDLAFGEAEQLGMELVPNAWLARQMNFAEYSELAGERTVAFFGTVDLSPSLVVWVVSMRGDLSTPILDGNLLTFDNLTVVLDAANGEVYQVVSLFEQYESGVRLPGFYTRDLPCLERDRGVFARIFQSNCPWPVEPESGEGEESGPVEASAVPAG